MPAQDGIMKKDNIFENGWAVQLWGDRLGLRFSRGANDSGVNIEILAENAGALELLADKTFAQAMARDEDFDGQPMLSAFWEQCSVEHVLIFAKRLLAMVGE